ncbi:MAG: TIGR03067 domain-containing protein [Acidobacteria bacterium]|nr:TIGR03067 domain-containing protein [Acidobacteriota bacterium]
MNIKILLTIALVWPFFFLLNNKFLEDDRKMIEGTWVIVEAELGGQKLPDESVKGTKLILTVDKYRYQNDQGEYKLYPAEEIKAMDIIGREGPNKGKNFLAIYELEGDKLKICYDLAGKTRPKKFKTETGTQQFLVTYQREKD